MSVAILFEGEIAIPPGIESLEEFRRWAVSDQFPERGRIDYIDGVIEVEYMPERMSSHGAVKVSLVRRLSERVLDNDLGSVYVDQTRASTKTSELVNGLVCKLRAVLLRKEEFAHVDAIVLPLAGAIRRGVQDGSL